MPRKFLIRLQFQLRTEGASPLGHRKPAWLRPQPNPPCARAPPRGDSGPRRDARRDLRVGVPNRWWAIMRGERGTPRHTRCAPRCAAVAAETSACDAPYASHARRLHARAPARDSLTARRLYP